MSLLDLKSLKTEPEELGHLLKKLFSKGKSVRCRLIRLVGGHLDLKLSDQKFLCRIVEYIHNSSLLHDDFLDHSLVRRSQKTAWLEFSPAQAVLAGDYLLAQVGIYLAHKNSTDLLKFSSETIMSLVTGEFLQRELIRDKKENLENVKKAGILKTASLFKWALRAPFIHQKRTQIKLHNLLNQIGDSLGVLFQRSDDLLDFSLRDREDKEAFIDLKQNYLNSFACFLVDKKAKSVRAELRKVRNFKSFSSLFPDYKSRLQAFDEINEQLIEKTKKDIAGLNRFLKPKEQGLIENLKNTLAAYYWRQSNR